MCRGARRCRQAGGHPGMFHRFLKRKSPSVSTNSRVEITTAARPETSATGSRFGRWYRSRPLIGGILIVVAGIEMVLSGQLDLGSIHIQVGIEGMQAMILPFALVTLGVLIIVMPVHRMFYGIMCLALSIYAVVGVNLGGFLIGTVLGLVGGIMCVSWMPKHARNTDSLVEPPPLSPAAAETEAVTGDDTVAAAPRPRGGSLTIIAIALLVCASATGLTATPSFADTPTPEPVATPVSTPEPAPSAPANPSPTPSVAADPLPADSPTPAIPAVPPVPATFPAPKPAAPHAASKETLSVDPTNDPDAPLAAIPSARLRSTAVTLHGARFIGTVGVPLAGGTAATVLKITADSLMMVSFALDSTDPAARALTMGASTLSLAGPVILYCASLSGSRQDGTSVSFDPSSPPPLGVDLPSLENVTISLVTVTGAAASLTGAMENVR